MTEHACVHGRERRDVLSGMELLSRKRVAGDCHTLKRGKEGDRAISSPVF